MNPFLLFVCGIQLLFLQFLLICVHMLYSSYSSSSFSSVSYIQLLLLQFLLISVRYPAPTPPVPSHQCIISSSYSPSSFSSVCYIQLLLLQFLLICVHCTYVIQLLLLQSILICVFLAPAPLLPSHLLFYSAPTPPVPYYLCVIKLPLLHFLLPSPGLLLSLSTPLSLWQGK